MQCISVGRPPNQHDLRPATLPGDWPEQQAPGDGIRLSKMQRKYRPWQGRRIDQERVPMSATLGHDGNRFGRYPFISSSVAMTFVSGQCSSSGTFKFWRRGEGSQGSSWIPPGRQCGWRNKPVITRGVLVCLPCIRLSTAIIGALFRNRNSIAEGYIISHSIKYIQHVSAYTFQLTLWPLIQITCMPQSGSPIAISAQFMNAAHDVTRLLSASATVEQLSSISAQS